MPLESQHAFWFHVVTNTYYEGDVADQPEARRGHSKEKRSDCKLLTLGLVLDGGGFVRRSRVFAGNVKEDRTLSGAYSRPKLPLIPEEACHPFHAKAATDSTAKLPPWQVA